MQNSRVTPGVERILDRARQLARAAGARELEPRHLFWAIFDVESRGLEILQQQGISADGLPGEKPPEADPGEAVELAQGEQVQQVLSRAGVLAARQGRYAELGSEHLLFGLVAVDCEVSDHLKEHGLTTEVLGKLIDIVDEQPDLPLPVDFELSEVRKSAGDETDLYRILDAAANRVREGVRVLEDYARFGGDDQFLTSQLKSWRHDLRAALSQVDDRKLLSSRDTESDVGTDLSTPAERHRRNLDEVLRANCKRVQEGLRTLEEFGKIVSPAVGDALGQLRYRFYTIEKQLVTKQSSQERLAGRKLYLLLSRDQCALDWQITLDIALKAGADIVQLREKNLADRELVNLGREVRKWTREAGALFIMNDRPDLAVLTDADGVHIGQEELSVREARRIVGPSRLIGVSTHTIEQARTAVEDGADYLGVGPVFPSRTKAFSELAGLEFIRQVAEEIRLPWYAIGGIILENIADLLQAGAQRIAVSQAILSSDSPGDIITKFKEVLN